MIKERNELCGKGNVTLEWNGVAKVVGIKLCSVEFRMI